MNFSPIEPGKYVVAVSGGVDSVVLLDLLAKQRLESGGQRLDKDKKSSKLQTPNSKLQILVAHFDHGIRPDSEADRHFVQKLAAKYGLPFVFDQGNLGAKASEATARSARYIFLEKVQAAAGADAIITAHHQDDALETAIINLLRGTGRKGLTALKSTKQLVRPLLQVSKVEILAYAEANKLKWREDATNQDTSYLRNYVRAKLLPKFALPQRERFLALISNLRTTNQQIDKELDEVLETQTAKSTLDRRMFVMLAHGVAREVMTAWLRRNGVAGFDRKQVERLITAAKTYRPGKQADVISGATMKVKKDQLELTKPEKD